VHSPDGGVVSTFKFLSYKVDDFEFHMEKDFSILNHMGTFDSSMWEFMVMIRAPMFFEARNQYLSGVKCTLSLRPDVGNPEFKPLQLSATISGIFETEGRFDEKAEQSLIRLQMPAILFPYIRGTISSFLANAGFGSVLLPLINIHKVAENALEGIPVNVISNQPTPELSPAKE
jgi:preprotein translocase subunit SecB